MHVSSQIVKAPSADTTRPASVPASSSPSSFSAAYASASQAGNSQKAQGNAKQGSEKKPAREKTSSGETPASTTAPVSTLIPPPPASATVGIPTVVSAPDRGANGDTGTGTDLAGAAGSSTDVKADPSAGGLGDGSVTSSDQTAPSKGLTAAAADTTDASRVPQSEVDPAAAKAALLAATQSTTPLPVDGRVQGDTQADAMAAATPTVSPDAAAQAIASAQVSPQQTSPAQPWGLTIDRIPASVDSPGTSSLKLQSSAISGTNSLTKQSIGVSKERGTQPDVRGKRKSDDSDASAPDAKTDASMAGKIALQLQQADAQPGSSSHSGADTQDLQQAMQAVTSTGSGSFSNSTMNAADNNAASAQTPAPAGTPSAHTATDVQALPAVNTAHLIQSMGQSEMKLGMHSAEFGSISINTSVTHEALSASISTSHAALGQALAVHLPSIEERLGNTYGLQARVEVRDSSGSASGDTTQQSKDGRQSQGNGSGSRSSTSTYGSSGISGTTVRSTSLSLGSSRLDIRI